jgi:hypothetical protein
VTFTSWYCRATPAVVAIDVKLADENGWLKPITVIAARPCHP